MGPDEVADRFALPQRFLTCLVIVWAVVVCGNLLAISLGWTEETWPAAGSSFVIAGCGLAVLLYVTIASARSGQKSWKELRDEMNEFLVEQGQEPLPRRWPWL